MIGPLPIFWKFIGTPQHRIINMFPSPKWSMFCHPPSTPFSILCTWKLNHGQTIWDKRWRLLGTLRENIENLIRTQCKHIKNIPKSSPLYFQIQPKAKNKLSLNEHSHQLHEIFIFKTICHHFQRGPILPIINWAFIVFTSMKPKDNGFILVANMRTMTF